MRYLLLALLLFGHVLIMAAQTAGESTAEPTAEVTPTLEDALPFVPFTLPSSGINGIAPQGWDMLQAGTFLRNATEDDATYIIQLASQEDTVTELLDPFLPVLAIEALPDSTETYESDTLSWTLYSVALPVDADEPEFIVDIASAQGEDAAYAVILQTAPDENADLRESVYYPTLDYFGAPVTVIYQALGLAPLRTVDLPQYNLQVAVPVSWVDNGDGLWSRGALDTDGTTLLFQTDTRLESREFGTLLLEQLGIEDGLPPILQTYDTPYLEWEIYESIIQTDVAPVVLYTALAQDDRQSYLVAMLVSAADVENLLPTVLLSALDNTRPLE